MQTTAASRSNDAGRAADGPPGKGVYESDLVHSIKRRSACCARSEICSIGDALLMAHWGDPDFDPGQRALYYIRVIEIPTPRWTAYDAKRFGIEMPEEVTMTVTDRAYTSPIWYTP